MSLASPQLPIGGVVLVEVVFAFPGIGRYAVDSLLVNDFAPVQGFVLVVLVVYLCVNLLADLLYGLVNPQVRASLGPIVTQSTMNLSWAILNAAGLSFLGLGVQPPTPEWGVMISEGSPYIVSGQWWMSFFPGAALILMTAGFILIGDGVNAGSER